MKIMKKTLGTKSGLYRGISSSPSIKTKSQRTFDQMKTPKNHNQCRHNNYHDEEEEKEEDDENEQPRL